MLTCTPRRIAPQRLASHPRGMPRPRRVATTPSGSVHARACVPPRALLPTPRGMLACPRACHGLDCFAHGGCQGLGLGCCLPTYLK
nr:hypothetical protein CFP56_77609 [Quercus suber]